MEHIYTPKLGFRPQAFLTPATSPLWHFLLHVIAVRHSLGIMHRDIKPQNVMLVCVLLKIHDFTEFIVKQHLNNVLTCLHAHHLAHPASTKSLLLWACLWCCSVTSALPRFFLTKMWVLRVIFVARNKDWIWGYSTVRAKRQTPYALVKLACLSLNPCKHQRRCWGYQHRYLHYIMP